jgi:hypothetical protein
MALAVKDTSGDIVCRSDGNAKCSIALGENMTLAVLATKPPAGGYVLAQAWINYGDLLSYVPAPVAADEVTWPDASFSIRGIDSDAVDLGAITGLVTPLPVSFYVGAIFEFAFSCTSTPSSSNVELLPNGDPVARTRGALYTEASSNGPQIIPEVGALTVSCVDIGPSPVGGVALGSDLRLLPLGTSEPDSPPWTVAVALVAATFLVTVGGVALWTKRLVAMVSADVKSSRSKQSVVLGVESTDGR